MIETDFFSIEPQPDGRYFIMKNGQFYLSCSSEQTAMEAVAFLEKDNEDEK